MGKKRKIDAEKEELERSLYSGFVSAANAVSQLYTQGVQQQRRAAAAASKATLEKIVGFVLRQNENSEVISKAALLHFLQHEYENADSSDTTPQPTMQFMPFQQAAAAASEETADTHPHLHKAHRQMSGNNMLISPGGRTASSGRLMGLDEQQHLQQQQQQQQLQQQQQQQHQLQMPLQSAEAMQLHGGMMHAAGPFVSQGNQQGMGPAMFGMPPQGPGGGMQ